MDNTRTTLVWFPGKTICIDESMTKNTSTRCPIRQQMSAKPISVDSKSFTTVDSYGVCIYMHMYKETRGLEKVHKKLPLHVVESVMAKLITTGHRIITDNWYGSIEALREIKHHGNCSILMMRHPRPLSKDSPVHKTSIFHKLFEVVNKKSLRRASTAAFLGGECMALLWRDNEVVAMLTDACNNLEDEGLKVKRTAKGWMY